MTAAAVVVAAAVAAVVVVVFATRNTQGRYGCIVRAPCRD